MQTSPTSTCTPNELIAMNTIINNLNSAICSKTATVNYECKSGQRLYASAHLMPGWICTGPTNAPCRTFNGVNRKHCKHCGIPRDITLAEFQAFHNALAA